RRRPAGASRGPGRPARAVEIGALRLADGGADAARVAPRPRERALLSTEAMSPLEVACGLPFGGTTVPLPESDRHPARALEDATVAALEGPGPALVAYSGGRDSALVLAAATAAARRHGLPEPIPLTIRLPGVAAANE